MIQSVTPPPICSLNAVNTEFVRTVSITASQVIAVNLQHNDLVVQHKEQVMFNNPNTGIYQFQEITEMCIIMPVLIVYDRSFPHLLLFSIAVLTEAHL